MHQFHRIPFLVIGGGLGGLATALALSRKRYPVHVLEKAHEFGEIGAGIQIALNGSRALDELGVLGETRSYAVYPERLLLVDALSNTILTTLDFGEPFRRAYTYPYFVMHRNNLLTILLHACRQSDAITLETNCEVTAVEDLGGGARVTCADGLKSVVHTYVIGDGEPVCAEFVAYRGAVPMEEVIEFAGMDTIRYWIGRTCISSSIRCTEANSTTRWPCLKASATGRIRMTGAPRRSWKRTLQRHTRA